jgi:hypothetical protein
MSVDRYPRLSCTTEARQGLRPRTWRAIRDGFKVAAADDFLPIGADAHQLLRFVKDFIDLDTAEVYWLTRFDHDHELRKLWASIVAEQQPLNASRADRAGEAARQRLQTAFERQRERARGRWDDTAQSRRAFPAACVRDDAAAVQRGLFGT